MPQYLPPGNGRSLPALRATPVASGREYEHSEDASTLAPLDLRQILVILRRRAWIILSMILLCGGVASWIAFSAAPVYEATGTVRLTDDRRQLTGGLVDATENGGALRTSTDPVLSEIAVLTSRAVIGKVVDSLPGLRVRTTGFSLRDVTQFGFDAPGPQPMLAAKIALAFGTHEITATAADGTVTHGGYGAPLSSSGVHFTIPTRPREKHGTLDVLRRETAAQRLANSVKVKPRENTSVIDVSFASTDPLLAQSFVNTLIDVFQENSVDIAAEQARLRRQFIESQLKQNDSLLTTARFAISDFRSREKAYSAREKFTAQATDVNALRTQIQDLELQQRLYASVLQAIDQGKGRESLQQLGALLSSQGAAASAIVTDLYMQMVKLQGARDSLITMGQAPTNPDVQRIDALMTTSNGRLKLTLQGIVTTLAARLSTLEHNKAQSVADLSAIPSSDADEARLTEREAAYQKIADQLRDELQKARLAEAAEVGSVEIVDTAMRPGMPIGIAARNKILFGVLLGLLFGSGCALVIEHLDQSIRGRDDVEASLQLPGLTVIPRLDGGPALVRHAHQALGNGKGKGKSNGNGNGNGASGNPKPVSGALVTVRDARSVGAEAYRTLRTKLLFSRALNSLKTIVVTSPFAQDGKSTVAANLATTFAQHGMRTLLIDCDLRRPTQHEIFGVSSKPGLTDLLLTEDLIPGAGRRTAVENLSLITSGALPPDPPELIGSARMRTLLERLGETFDVIVLDSPPVLPVADSAILASLADGALLVVRAGKTDRRAAQLAVQQLQDVDARILGAVLNDPNEQVPLYDQYSYATYYGYASKE